MGKLEASDITGALTRKFGPLPAWGWAAIIVGGLYAYNVYASRDGVAKVAGSEYPVDAATLPIDLSGADGGYDGYDVLSPSLPPRGTTSPQTNAQWARIAGDWLTGLGLYPESLVQSVLAKYINGSPLQPGQETSILNAAIRAFGTPPEGPIAANVPPTPVPVPTPTRQPADFLAPGIHAIGRLGGSYNLRDIARRATPAALRGQPDAVESMLRRIVAANPALHGRTKVTGGTRIVVPR